MQDAIKQLKLKDYQENKESIGLRIKHLEENIRLIENTEGNNDLTLNNQSIIDENIRKARVKEIKSTKSVLEQKLFSLESQIKSLMNEEFEKDKKKQNIKNYLDNFEKDKKESEIKSKEFEKRREERMKYLKEVQLKAELKVKEKYEKIEEEKLNKETKKREEYEQNLIKMRQKSIDFLEEKIMQRNNWKQEQKAIEGKVYIHNKYEEMFKKKEEKYQEEINQKIEEETLKRKIILKPIKHVDLDEFQRKYEEERKTKILEKDKERILRFEEIRNNASNDIKSTSLIYYKVIKDEKQIKEKKEKQKLEKNYTSLRRGNFSKIIRENIPLKSDVTKKKEVADRIFKLKTSKIISRKSYDRSKIVLLKKHDPNKPYNNIKWKMTLSLDESNEKDEKKAKRPRSHYGGSGSNSSFFRSSSLSRPLSGQIGSNSSSGYSLSKNLVVDKRVPLNKNPDYLTENRIKKSHNPMSLSVNKSNYLFILK